MQILCYRLLPFITLLFLCAETYSKPVNYKNEAITAVSTFTTGFSQAYLSKSQPEIIYLVSSFHFFRYNQTSGDRTLLLGCNTDHCVSDTSLVYGQSYPSTNIIISIASFYVDETLEETVYVANPYQIFKLKSGNLTLLSNSYNISNTVQNGMNISNANFFGIRSITMDPIGNLYIGEKLLYRINSNGIISSMSMRYEGFLLSKNDGFLNETSFTGFIYGIQYYNGYLYGNDAFSIFKINLQTEWLTVIQGKAFLGSTDDNGPAINAELHYLNGIAILPEDESILLTYLGYVKLINVSTGNISTLFKLDDSIPHAVTIFSPNFLFHAMELLKLDRLTERAYSIYSVNGALEDGVNVGNRIFDSITAIAFNESSNELFIADSKLGYNLKKIDMSRKIISTFTLKDKFSNVSCWNSSEVTSKDILAETFNPNSMQISNSSFYISTISMIQKIGLSKSGKNGCFYAGSISSDRLRRTEQASSLIMKNPTGLSCHNNLIFIADTENHRILKYYHVDQMVQVVAGTGIAGFSGDGELAINAQLDRPHSVYYDQFAGNIYIADSGNSRIRMIFSNGTIATIAGNDVSGFNGDNLNALETQLNFPKYVFYDSNVLYISDSNNHRIRALINDTITTILGNGITGSKIVSNDPKKTQLDSPFGIFLFQNTLYVADTYNHRILSVYLGNPSSVSVIAGTGSPGFNGDGIATQTKLFLPSTVTVYNDPSIFIHIADTYNNRVRVISGQFIIFSKKVNSPIGLCTYNNIYNFAVSSENSITGSDGNIGGVGDGSNVYYANVNPTRILLRSDNKMIISESDSNRIRMIDNIAGGITTIAGTGQFGFSGENDFASIANLASPTGLAQGTDSNYLYFADSSNNRIRTVIHDSIIKTVAGIGEEGRSKGETDPLKAKFNNPRVVSVLSNGDLLIGDTFNNRVYSVSKSGTMRLIEGFPKEIITDMIVTKRNSILYSTASSIYLMKPYCEEGFQLVNENTECIPICFGLYDGTACTGRGKCISPNNCSCPEGLYTGNQCEIPICFGISGNDTRVCSYSNGTCGNNNKCQCNEGFYGDTCQNPICFSKNIEESCGGKLRGSCVNKDKCSCTQFYTGERCELRMCSGVSEKETNVCNGHGKCLENGRCECDALYAGNDCSDLTGLYALSITAALLLLIIASITVVSFILGLVIYRKNRKELKILETELSLDERLLSFNDNYEISVSSVSVVEDPTSFVIPLHKIGMDKPIKRLGEGGIGSVFMSKYNGMIVAVKVFDLNNMNISEEDFTNEAILLSKLRHPNIINFYGVSTSPTKRYIVMECLDQSMEKVIAKLEFKQLTLSLQQKFKMILNIANGIEYLHGMKPRKIIHRDLKPQNILLDSNGNCKVCDFGLSKSISQATLSALTNQLGTHFYMSPEMFDIQAVDPTFATAVDIYSFSIIMWQLLFEIKDPYLFKSPEILNKLKTKSLDQVSSYQLTKLICENDYRPSIPFNSIETCQEWCSEFMNSEQHHSTVIYKLCLIIKQCWQTDPKLRPSIEQVIDQLESLEQDLQ